MPLDLNADLGEGASADDALMLLIRRANIACGGHAGDLATMHQSVMLAQRYNVAIGAHPSYLDHVNFGRVETNASPAEIEANCSDQLAAFDVVVKQHGAEIAHVKPHGALYHRVMGNADAAQAFLRAITQTLGRCAVMGLPGSTLQALAERAGVSYVSEMFADRRYEADGTLTPRSHPEALILDIQAAVAQVLSVRDLGGLYARTGEWITLTAETVCVHGDGEHALRLAELLHQTLTR